MHFPNKVAVNGSTGQATAERARMQGDMAIFLRLDISMEESARAMAAKVASRYGAINPVNNAARFGR